MQSLEFNKRVTLQQVRTGTGHNRTDETIKELTVWANVQEPSMSLKLSTASVGMSADRIVHLWRHEFEGGAYNRVIISGIVYRIESIGASVNDQFVKLIVVRG